MTQPKTDTTTKKKKLTQVECGFICCLSNTVHGHGANTAEFENYKIIGSPSPDLCRASGLSEYDIEAVEILGRGI